MPASNELKKPHTPSTPSRDILYAEAAKHAPRAIEIAVEIMEHGDNDSARLGAVKTILAKAIPDLKAMEITGPNGEKLEALVIIKNKDGNSTLPVAN